MLARVPASRERKWLNLVLASVPARIVTVVINASASNNAKERMDVVSVSVLAVMGVPANVTKINASVQKIVVQ